jgi:hypothetical protein
MGMNMQTALFVRFATVLKKPKTNPENDPVENDLRKWRQLIIISATSNNGDGGQDGNGNTTLSP